MSVINAQAIALACSLYNSPLTSLIEAKYGWETGSDESDEHFEILNIALRVGVILGSLTGGPIVKYGRRLCLIIGCAIGVVGVALTIPINFPLFVTGRFITGIAHGITTVGASRYIEEYIPLALFGTMVAVKHVFEGIGYLWAYFSVDMLPVDSDTAALKANTSYYIIFALPGIFWAISIILMLTIIRHDTPKFYMMQGEDEKAISVIHKIYKTDDNDAQAQRILRFFKNTGTKETSNVTVKEALWADDKYTRATWVSIGLSFFYVYCGYHFI